MKLTKLTVVVVVLAAGLGMACDKALPTETWDERLLDKPEPNWRVPVPVPCAAGTPVEHAYGCTPLGPVGPLDDPPA